MRNTLEYPVTLDETISTIDYLQKKEIEKMSIGSMTPLILRYIKEYITNNPDSFKEFLKGKY